MAGLVFAPPEAKEEILLFLKNLAPGKRIHLGEVSLRVTPELEHLLRQILESLAHGTPVRVVPLEAELTTGEAAAILGVSRPYLVRLLEEGAIPYHKVGTHRRIRGKDLLEYLERSRRQGKDLVNQLTAEAQELGLGY
ncbi:helix-turn-helix domain-containing protein [Thermus sediminis]|uniref:helix-turn-helix domain-containing protein n=1 Tax=Thermus sediminis TaxID=1761908 RepID=UPI000E3B92CA|nr:helix-turn-helix domain-containing protein [Thermus sediminis]